MQGYLSVYWFHLYSYFAVYTHWLCQTIYCNAKIVEHISGVGYFGGLDATTIIRFYGQVAIFTADCDTNLFFACMGIPRAVERK